MIVRLYGAKRDTVKFQVGLPFIHPVSFKSFLLFSIITATHLPFQARWIETWPACLGTCRGSEKVQDVLMSGGRWTTKRQGIGCVCEKGEVIEDALHRAWDGEE